MAVYELTSPQGEIYEVTAPDDATEAQVMSYFRNSMMTDPNVGQQAVAPKESVFLSPEREQAAQDIRSAYESGQIGMPRAIGQSIGKVGFGAVTDAIGNVVSPIIESLPFINDYRNAMGNILQNTQVGQGIVNAGESALQKYAQFSQQNPNLARDIESVGNIASFVAPVKAKTVSPMAETPLGALGRMSKNSAEKSIDAKRMSFLQDLVTPIQNKAVKEDQVSRTIEEGRIFKTSKVLPSKEQQDMMRTLKDLNIVNPKNTFQGNYNNIAKEISSEAESLKKALEKENVSLITPEKVTPTYKTDSFGNKVHGDSIVTPEHNRFVPVLQKAVDELSAWDTLRGNAKAQANRLASKMYEFIEKEPQTTAGLLEARKKFYNFIENGKKDEFDSDVLTAFAKARKVIAKTTNDFIAENTTSKDVKASLKKQSNLFDAMDVVEPKAAQQPKDALSRLVKKVDDQLLTTQNAKRGAATVGLALAAPKIAAGLAVLGGTVYTGKLLTSPIVRKTVGKMLEQADKSVRYVGDKDAIRQLRLDRSALIDLMKANQGSENDRAISLEKM